MKIFIATGNKKKIGEIKPLLAGYEVLSIADGVKIPEVVEDKDTFKGNAIKKAQTIYDELKKIDYEDVVVISTSNKLDITADNVLENTLIEIRVYN